MNVSLAPSIIGFVGLIFCLAAAILYACLPFIVRDIIRNTFVLENDTETYENWVQSPIAVNIRFYLFNVTNAHEVETLKHRPKLEEIGPFVFREKRHKEIWENRKQEGTITYAEKKSFHFVQDLSESLDEEVTVINLPLVASATIIDKMAKRSYFDSVVRSTVSSYILKRGESLFVTKKARELLFDGYHVQLVEDLVRLGRIFKFDVPEVLPNNTFGLFYGKNNTPDGLFTVSTGKKQPETFTLITKWNELEKLPYWGNTPCDEINGTDGFQFPPFIKRTHVLYAFSPDLCRSIHFVYEKDVAVEGVPSFRFILPKSLFMAPHVDPNNKCFCLHEDYCDINGVLDLSSCQSGAPIISSAPHFYEADQSLLDDFHGMEPSKERHESFLDVEPMTGIVVRGARRIQINVRVLPIQGIEILENVQEFTFPIMWLDEGATIDETHASEIKNRLEIPISVGNIGLITVMGLGTLVFVVSMCYSMLKTSKVPYRRDRRTNTKETICKT